MNLFKRHGLILLLLGAVAGTTVSAQKTRTIVFNEDRDQHYMTSKVYKLSNVKAHDIMPFILGAVKRYDSESSVKSLDYKGQDQYIVVSTGSNLLPYIDEMVKTLDYYCDKKDNAGSVVDGDGIYRFSYCSKYRGSTNMKDVVDVTFTGGYGNGASYYDEPTNMFYWKTSKSQGQEYMKFLEAIDRPVPQMQVQLKIYMIDDNDFRELGIDYLSWKNGPGANLFGVGYDYSDFSSVTSIENAIDIVAEGPLSAATGLGGIVFAPQFDATFLRMLAQKGKAKVAASAMLTLVNDFGEDAYCSDWDSAKYRFKFTPQYQNVQKDEDRSMSVSVLDNSEMAFYVSGPIICFSGYEADKAATLMCEWNLAVTDMTEQTNDGIATVNAYSFDSTLTIQGGTEKLIATFDKDLFVKQYSGMPFLGDIPVLKYLFGAESMVKSKTKIFVTMVATPILPETDMPGAAGKIIEAAKLAANE